MTELTLSQINGRFKIRPAGDAAPGKCSVCGNVKNQVVDFDLDVDFYGAVAICTECFISAAELLDLVPQDRVRTLQLQIQGHEDELTKVTGVVDEYAGKFVDLYAEFVDRLRAPSSSSDAPDEALHDGTELPDEVVSLGTEPTTEPVIEQSTVFDFNKGPAIVSSSHSNGFEL